MRIIVVFLLSISSAAVCYSQEKKFFGKYDHLIYFGGETKLEGRSWELKNSSIKDTTELIITYEKYYILDTLSNNIYRTRMILEIGSAWHEYYSLTARHYDEVYTESRTSIKMLADALKMPEDRKAFQAMAGANHVNSEIWIDKNNKKLTDRLHDYFVSDTSWEYEEDLPVISWEFQNQSDSINGYHCFTATTNFRGREWKVWFTPEIPVNAGPWKFNGLPGLILKAEESQGQYKWECVGVEQVKQPMYYYQVKTKTYTKEKLMKLLRNIHDNPYEMATGALGDVFIHDRTMTPLDHTWTMPYNPIER